MRPLCWPRMHIRLRAIGLQIMFWTKWTSGKRETRVECPDHYLNIYRSTRRFPGWSASFSRCQKHQMLPRLKYKLLQVHASRRHTVENALAPRASRSVDTGDEPPGVDWLEAVERADGANHRRGRIPGRTTHSRRGGPGARENARQCGGGIRACIPPRPLSMGTISAADRPRRRGLGLPWAGPPHLRADAPSSSHSTG
jgi:hypothetical protein